MSEDFEPWCVVCVDIDSGEERIVASGYNQHEAIEASYSLNNEEREGCRYYARRSDFE